MLYDRIEANITEQNTIPQWQEYRISNCEGLRRPSQFEFWRNKNEQTAPPKQNIREKVAKWTKHRTVPKPAPLHNNLHNKSTAFQSNRNLKIIPVTSGSETYPTQMHTRTPSIPFNNLCIYIYVCTYTHLCKGIYVYIRNKYINI